MGHCMMLELAGAWRQQLRWACGMVDWCFGEVRAGGHVQSAELVVLLAGAGVVTWHGSSNHKR